MTAAKNEKKIVFYFLNENKKFILCSGIRFFNLI